MSFPNDSEPERARRQFLTQCGRFAVATPPAITLLLATSHARYAVAVSGAITPGGNGLGVTTGSSQGEINWTDFSTAPGNEQPVGGLTGAGTIVTSQPTSLPTAQNPIVGSIFVPNGP